MLLVMIPQLIPLLGGAIYWFLVKQLTIFGIIFLHVNYIFTRNVMLIPNWRGCTFNTEVLHDITLILGRKRHSLKFQRHYECLPCPQNFFEFIIFPRLNQFLINGRPHLKPKTAFTKASNGLTVIYLKFSRWCSHYVLT